MSIDDKADFLALILASSIFLGVPFVVDKVLQDDYVVKSKANNAIIFKSFKKADKAPSIMRFQTEFLVDADYYNHINVGDTLRMSLKENKEKLYKSRIFMGCCVRKINGKNLDEVKNENLRQQILRSNQKVK